MRWPVCLYVLSNECLFLKMNEDESPIARRQQINNERQVKYRSRQPSETRRQANADYYRIRRLTINPKLVCDKEFT